MKRREQQQGFISLEALVAFTILTLSLTAIYQVFANTYSSTSRVTYRDVVLAEAQSFMEAVGVVIPATPGTRTGTFDSGAHWIMVSERLGGNGQEGGIGRYWIRLSVETARGKPVLDLETIVLEGEAK